MLVTVGFVATTGRPTAAAQPVVSVPTAHHAAAAATSAASASVRRLQLEVTEANSKLKAEQAESAKLKEQLAALRAAATARPSSAAAAPAAATSSPSAAVNAAVPHPASAAAYAPPAISASPSSSTVTVRSGAGGSTLFSKLKPQQKAAAAARARCRPPPPPHPQPPPPPPPRPRPTERPRQGVHLRRERRRLATPWHWLSGNATERHYATIPLGQRIEESTFAGQCWRARGPRSSGHHVLSYCATEEPVQYAVIAPQAKVALYFHYPKPPHAVAPPTPHPAGAANASSGAAADAHAGAGRATVFELTQVLGALRETPVGHVVPGSHLSTVSKPGCRYRVRDEATRRPLLSVYEAGHEAEQHVDVSPYHTVTVAFELAPSTPASEAVAVFWTWGEDDDAAGDGGRGGLAREHLAAELDHPGQVVTLRSVAAGEELVVRRSAQRGTPIAITEQDVLMRVVASEAPLSQRHLVVVPPRAAAPPTPDARA